MIRFRLQSFDREKYRRSDTVFLLRLILWLTVQMGSITEDVYLDRLVKLGSVSISHGKVTLSFL